MAKVNFKRTTTEVSFERLSGGDYFIYNNKLYLKVNDICAFDFEGDELLLFCTNTLVSLQDSNDIEVTVN